jgi:hypothetical protein
MRPIPFSHFALLVSLAAGLHCGGTAQSGSPGNRDAAATDASDDSGSSTFGDDSASDSAPGPVPDVFVRALVGPGTLPQQCTYASEELWLTLGQLVPRSKPTTVPAGSSQLGNTLSVQCAVRPVAGGFDVSLDAALSNGVGMSILPPSGTPGAVNATTGGQGLTGIFTPSATNGWQYNSSSCSIAFTYNAAPVPANAPISAGRIWAHVSCPDAQNRAQSLPAPDGGTTYETCDFEADFLFENCSQ